MSKKLASEMSLNVRLGRVSSTEVENDLSPLIESLIRGPSESNSFKNDIFFLHVVKVWSPFRQSSDMRKKCYLIMLMK